MREKLEKNTKFNLKLIEPKMPDPNKKISTPSQDSPCEIKLACTGGTEEKKKTCEKTIEIEEETPQKKAKKCKSVVEEQAALNKKPCPSGVGCQLARPDHTNDPAARIDKTKSGCINFESCEEEEEKQVEEKKLESGCLDYEDCEDYLKEEKRRIKKMKEEEKQKRKEKLAKAKPERS